MVDRPRAVIFSAHATYSHKQIERALVEADELTEYDVILFTPDLQGVYGGSSERGVYAEVDTASRAELLSLLIHRRAQFNAFLALGGVAVVLLGPFGGYSGGVGVRSVHAVELVIDADDFSDMGIVAGMGASLTVLDANDPMATYLNRIKGWQATMTRGVLARDPLGFALAVNRDDRVVAYVEHVRRGVVYWLPAPTSDEEWSAALAAAKDVWQDQDDPLLGLAGTRLKELEDELAALRSRLGSEIRRVMSARGEVLASRRRLVTLDRTVDESLQRFRAAQHASPARALDFYHRMLEVIEHEFGGEKKAMEELKISKGKWDDVTRPANHKPYRARHEGGEGEPVPPPVLEKAKVAAAEVLGVFLDRRLNDMAGSQAGHP